MTLRPAEDTEFSSIVHKSINRSMLAGGMATFYLHSIMPTLIKDPHLEVPSADDLGWASDNSTYLSKVIHQSRSSSSLLKPFEFEYEVIKEGTHFECSNIFQVNSSLCIGICNKNQSLFTLQLDDETENHLSLTDRFDVEIEEEIIGMVHAISLEGVVVALLTQTDSKSECSIRLFYLKGESSLKDAKKVSFTVDKPPSSKIVPLLLYEYNKRLGYKLVISFQRSANAESKDIVSTELLLFDLDRSELKVKPFASFSTRDQHKPPPQFNRTGQVVFDYPRSNNASFLSFNSAHMGLLMLSTEVAPESKESPRFVLDHCTFLEYPGPLLPNLVLKCSPLGPIGKFCNSLAPS